MYVITQTDMDKVPEDVWLRHIRPFLEAKEFYWMFLFINKPTEECVRILEKNMRLIGRHLLQYIKEGLDLDTIEDNIFWLLEANKDPLLKCYNVSQLNHAFSVGLFSKLFVICKTKRIEKTIDSALKPLLHNGTIKMASLLFMFRYMTQSRRTNSLRVIGCLLHNPNVVRV